MAPSAKNIPFLFLLCLLFSMQIHARERQFFSKVTSVNTNAQEITAMPNKQETLSKQEQEPTFIPESNTQGSYGLYGHESSRLPPTTTTTTTTIPTLNNVNGAPYTSNPTNVPFQTEFEDEESLNKYLDTNDNNYDNNQRNYNNYYNSKDSYEPNQNGPVDTRLTERGYPAMANQNNYYNGANQYYNVDKQGMSDTRFLENGKYFYDINSENYNNPNQYGNSRGVNSRIWYGNKGYYGNNENSFEHKKQHSMEGYQNEEEFQQEQDEFVP